MLAKAVSVMPLDVYGLSMHVTRCSIRNCNSVRISDTYIPAVYVAECYLGVILDGKLRSG